MVFGSSFSLKDLPALSRLAGGSNPGSRERRDAECHMPADGPDGVLPSCKGRYSAGDIFACHFFF
jgi:hypothetical protein